MFNSRTFKALLAVMTVLILAGAAYAFAAANTVPATKAGDGLGVISGYTVTNVVYDLNATDRYQIRDRTCNLSPAREDVHRVDDSHIQPGLDAMVEHDRVQYGPPGSRKPKGNYRKDETRQILAYNL